MIRLLWAHLYMLRRSKLSVMWLCVIGRQGPDSSGDCDIIIRGKLPKKDLPKHGNYSLGDTVSHHRRVYLHHHCENLKSCMFWVDLYVPCNYTRGSRNFLPSCLFSMCCFILEFWVLTTRVSVSIYILACLI